jgi:hypothetical protein
MADTPEDHEDDQPLTERFLDLFVFLPTGLAVTFVEELPRLAERGRERLGVQVNSARAVGQFTVRAGHREIRRRSEGLKRSPGGPPPAKKPTAQSTTASAGPPRLRAIPRPAAQPSPAAAQPSSAQSTATQPSAATSAPTRPPENADVTGAAPTRTVNGHVPDVASLAIPGFDTLSASQVVQRLDGLSRSELVAVRTYEASTRGRRTILSRVDQLLDERS